MFNLESGRGSRQREPWHRSSLICLSLVLTAVFCGCEKNAKSGSSENNVEQRVDAPSALRHLLDQESKDREKLRTGQGSAPIISPKFVEVAKGIGLTHVFHTDMIPKRYFLPEVMGGGAAWFDFDLDGWLDVYYANGRPLAKYPDNPAEFLSRLFRNRRDGTFYEITGAAKSGVCRYGQGISVGDFDADGFPDLYLANYDEDVLLHNLGDGTFEEITNVAFNNFPDKLWGEGSAWFDADQDGDLDLYVVNYLNVTFENTHACEYHTSYGFCGPGEYQAVPDYLFINQGDGTFVESLEAFGMTAEQGKGLVISVLDFDQDLVPEIYVGNDMTANFLFASPNSTIARDAGISSDKRYVEIATFAGCAVSRDGLNEATMGIACADFNHDGLFDIYLTHFFNNKNTLYRNLGNLSFVDDSYRTLVAKTSLSYNGFGVVAIDYDRDTFHDLLITNGHVLGPEFDPYAMRPQLLRNNSGTTFTDISDTAGPFFQDKMLGRGMAGGDYDNDGDLDVTISHLDRPIALLQNQTVTNRDFVGLELRTRDRVPPVGGRIIVKHTSGQQILPIAAGGSYESSHDPRYLVGLGDDHDPVTVQIYWPSGHVDEWNNLALNQYHVFYEGQSPRPIESPAPDRLP